MLVDVRLHGIKLQNSVDFSVFCVVYCSYCQQQTRQHYYVLTLFELTVVNCHSSYFLLQTLFHLIPKSFTLNMHAANDGVKRVNSQ